MIGVRLCSGNIRHWLEREGVEAQTAAESRNSAKHNKNKNIRIESGGHEMSNFSSLRGKEKKERRAKKETRGKINK